MSDTVVKFAGGQAYAASCGSKNPMVAAIANAMLREMNSFSVAQTQDVAAQSVGNAAAIASGGIGF